MSYWRDSGFQDKLVVMICKDRRFLKTCSSLLTSKDFQPKGNEARERWIVADIALQYFDKYREPINSLLKSECLDYARKSHLSDRNKRHLLEYVDKVEESTLEAADAIKDKVIEYKKEKAKVKAIEDLMELQDRGQLDDAKFMEICQTAIETTAQSSHRVVDYFKGLEPRILRRLGQIDRKYPMLLIDPLDQRIRTISRGHLGMFFAPMKRGKTLMAIHVGLAYALQSLKVLHITLEDPLEDIEDRFDAAITSLPIQELQNLPKRLRKRFARYKKFIRGRIKIVDCTEGGVTVKTIESIYESERNKGFHADAIIVDYDDEIAPIRKHRETRMEIADTYRALKQMAARHQLLVWVAAQTKRNTSEKKILTENDLAEDISKARKVSCGIGMGKGDWDDKNGVYLYVAVHRNDRQKIGWNILADYDHMLIYDREATLKRMREERLKPKEKK